MSVKLATVWLDGCSGCHMSVLDTDERLIELAEHIEVVWGPYVDAKEFPPDVDVTLIEGAVSTVEDLHKVRVARERTKLLVSLGDCAVTGNVPAMRNHFGARAVLQAGYGGEVPREVIPALLDTVRPVHEIVPVDVFVPGCPPSADLIYFVLSELIAGRRPELKARFG
jgi:NAD-reducing hydrogenase small subunit